MNLTDPVPRRAGRARRQLTLRGVLWLTRRIGQHALRNEWQMAIEAARSRDQLLAATTEFDPGVEALRAAAAESHSVLAADKPDQAP